jgi:hypothetical protein
VREREPFGGSNSASVHFGGPSSACVHFGGSCLLECSRGMRYQEFDVSSLRALPGIMTPVEQCRNCRFRSKRHVLRRQIRHLHRSAAEISSFSLPAAVSRREIDFRF